MPIYEYQCTACGHRFERFQGMQEVHGTICPECQGIVKKLMSPAGLIFKGSGWYKTDSRGAPPSESGSTDTAASTGDKKETAGSADSTKPATDGAGKAAAEGSSKAVADRSSKPAASSTSSSGASKDSSSS